MSTPLQLPERLGPYEVHEVLRRAAAVTTYGGIGPGGVPVVVKELRVAALGEWKEYELFRREVEVLAAVRHPGVPRVLDHLRLGEGPGERVCLVMERVPGEPLDERLRRGAPWEEREVRRILEGVLEVLEHLHALAPPILHRDVKPANIVVSPERVYLVDFGGVARFLPWARGGATVIGTFGYMAPEQLHGEATPASDLYGAGATAAALLGGCEAAELPRRGLRIDVDALPAAREPLRGVVRRLVEPEPAQRFASAREVLELLRGGAGAGAGVAQRRWGAEDDEGRGAGDGAGAAEGAAAAHRHAADVQDSAAGAKLTTAVRAFAAAPGRAVLRALPRDAHGVPVLSVAGPPPASVAGREVAVASVVGREVAVAHLGLRERLHRGMLVVAGCAAAGGLLVQFLRQSGGSGALGEVARVLFAVAFLVFAGSRVVPTRERLRRRLLKLARRRRGRVGILDAAVTLKVPPEVARELLDGLVAIGLARPDPDREGAYLVLAS